MGASFLSHDTLYNWLAGERCKEQVWIHIYYLRQLKAPMTRQALEGRSLSSAFHSWFTN